MLKGRWRFLEQSQFSLISDYSDFVSLFNFKFDLSSISHVSAKMDVIQWRVLPRGKALWIISFDLSIHPSIFCN